MSNPDLGPLAKLAGSWEGVKGDDVAPSDDRGTENNKYRELMVFEDIGLVENHEQSIYGLRYKTMAWRLGEDNPFHEEVGYWLWDGKEKQVMRCFIIPRGVTVLAGGTAEPGASAFNLVAEIGSDTYGICSNKFLDKEFKTVRYELNVSFQDDENFSYDETSVLKMKGREQLFRHTDKNTMRRVRS